MSTHRVIPIQPVASIHPRSVKGRFRTFKTSVLYVAYAVFFLLPWLPWSRSIGEPQALMFDVQARKFYIFDLVVHAQEVFWLAGFLFLSAIILFFSTSLAGRLFCGYFCFQTLWTDAFRMIERKVQGDKAARIRLDKQQWDKEKITKKLITHIFWLLLAFWSGLTFILYWGYAPEVFQQFFLGSAYSGYYITALGLTASTYIAAGFMRENICIHVCPYARFQSVMIDKDSKVISYDRERGEGVNGRKKPIKALKNDTDRHNKGHGDCIDCGYCVQVCPTGIDIRDGLQLECIQCGLCVDACDNIMDKQGWPRGLVRYVSERELAGGESSWLRPKVLLYAIAIMASTVLLVWSIMNSTSFTATIIQERSPLYVMLSDGRIQNRYIIKIDNKSEQNLSFSVSIQGLSDDAHLDMGRFERIDVEPDGSRRVLVKLQQMPTPNLEEYTVFDFILTPHSNEIQEPVTIRSQFILPN